MFRTTLQHLANRLGYRIERLRPPPPGKTLFVFDFVAQVLNGHRAGAVRFIQVGANDGRREDPLFAWINAFPWRGVLIEPLPAHVQELRSLHAGNPRIAVDQSVIGACSGDATLHYLRELPGIPAWATGISSLSLSAISAHRQKFVQFEQALTRIEVRMKTLADVMREYDMPEIDLLQIDAEGHDLEILRSIDFEAVSPAIVAYEHVNLSMDDRAEARRLLAGAGYYFAEWLGDTVCCKPALFPVSEDRQRFLAGQAH